MDDFEYSVEISDRDWNCFFQECEECNLLPPSLAGVDDSGMSDFDDTGSILAKRAQKVDPIADVSEAAHPIDGPPDFEGSPVEHYLSKHGVGGMESVLSGSEEDLHLQSVNIFFERLKNLTEAEKVAEPSQVRAGKNKEAILEEKQCSDGQQSSISTLPENIPKLNSLPARGETAVGKETMRPVDTISNINTMKKVKPGSNISPEPAASNSVLKTNKSTYPETELFIREEACTETGVNEATQWHQSHDSPDGVVCSETTTHTDEVMKVEMCTPLKDVEQEHLFTSQLTHSDRGNANSPSNLEMVTNVKWREEQNPTLLQLDTASINKSVSQESSPSASIKRKRRKKRRLSFEPADSAHGYERQGIVKLSDSEEEQYAGRGGTGLCLLEDLNSFYLNEPQKNAAFSLYSVTSNSPVRISAKETKANDLSLTVPLLDSKYQYLPESIVRQGRCKATSLVENNVTNDRSVTPLSQTDDSVMSAANNSSNVVTNLQPPIKSQDEEVVRLNESSCSPVPVTASVTGKSDVAREPGNSEEADKETLQLSDQVNHSITGCEQNLKCCTAEVKSITRGILPCAESNDPAVEVSQNDKLSAAKSVLAVEAGNSGSDNHTLCHRTAEPQQQLEIDSHDTDQYRSTLEKTHALNAALQQFKTRVCPFLEEISSKETCAKLTLDCICSSPDKSCNSKSPSSLDMNNTEQQTEHPLEVQTLSKLDILSEKNATVERPHLAGSQIMPLHSNNLSPSSEISQTGSSQTETTNLITNSSDITSVSSCYTLDTDSIISLSNGNATDLSGSFCSSVSQNNSGSQGEKNPLILAKHVEGDATSGPKSQSVSNDSAESKSNLLCGAENAVTTSKAECVPKKPPDSKNSVFAMSSFWNEMEKLTINDILGLRMISKAAPAISLPPLQESEETCMFPATDSSFLMQLDESKPEQTTEHISSVPDSAESSLGSVTEVDSSSSKSVIWESQPVLVSLGTDIYTENMMLTSTSDIPQPVLSGSAQKTLRKISKNVSVHNLHALESESFNSTWKSQTLQTLDEGEAEKVQYFSDERVPKQDKDMHSSTSSFANIFQYLFGGKQSVPSQSATDNITSFYTDGNSVPETYDHFFSEFDTEDFFSPLITADDQAKDKLIPIFSYSRNKNLQFPEAYDYFFASSSSDDSSVESDEDEDCSPLRVVSRFSRKASASQISTDTYDNFFTDKDLRQNFFSKITLSFRNAKFTGSATQKQSLSNSLTPVPVKQIGRSLRRTVYPTNALGNQDVMFPDPLLYHLEDRISRQQAQLPFRYEDLQTAVSNPRLDASFLPLRQSDMCMVCIAFASWVLKTANPQVGDAWKAVLLANVSALSAIRYLRKYVKTEAATNEEKLHHPALPEP